MAGPDGTYQDQIGFVSGALGNIAVMYVDTTGFMRFYDTNFSGTALDVFAGKGYRENRSFLIIGQGAVSTVFSVINLNDSLTYFYFSMTSTCIYASVWLPSVSAIGRELYIWLTRGSCASGRVWFSTSGCSLVNYFGSRISGFFLRNSVASCGWVHLVATNTSEWSVIEAGLSYAEA